ncbi:MAG: acyltransferase family protein [Actinophytocola sp.]|uniref:acyltransferase family protein n=1 Tax=Actinophytocola sp. TaxID=1872138 RepID=UPI00132CBC04|nr:acyltransferase [Actinophytocola sp.]MPZ81364.1 acyltransferase family protein [Actinophytocola sp.]
MTATNKATNKATDRSRQNRFVFLDIMRGIAPVLVIYSHVVALFLDPHGLDSPVVDLLSEQLRDPLRLEQQMGHLAVVMFFLVSGFIITQVGTSESHREFSIKRLFRIYPLLIATVGLTAILSIWNLEVLRTGQHFEITLQSVLTNFALANYFMVPQVILLGVAWTLVIEVIFYSMVLSLLAVLRRWTWLAILIELGLVLAALLLAREFGPSFFLLSVNMSYLPVVLLGQVTWAVWSGRVPLWLGTVFGFASWTLYVLGDIRNMGRLDDAYSSTCALGFGLFIVLLLAEPHLRPTRPISFLADRSYSLYLMHGPIAFPVMEGLRGVVPVWLAVVAGLALTVAAAEVTFRYVEQPGQRIGRRLTKRFRLKKAEPRKTPPERVEPAWPEPRQPEPRRGPQGVEPAWPGPGSGDAPTVKRIRPVPALDEALPARPPRPAPRPAPPPWPTRQPRPATGPPAPPVNGVRNGHDVIRGELWDPDPDRVAGGGRHRRED